MAADEINKSNFITEIIDADLKAGGYDGKIIDIF